MSGELTGVQRHFRNVVPHSFYINCRSHKLALCVKHLMKDFKVLEDVDAVLLAVFKMFEYSPQKFAVFKNVQSSYAVRELVMVRAAATRWLSHGVACSRFADRYVQILDTLDTLIQRKREPETISLRDMVTNKTTLAAILVLCDLLQPVGLFCKYLQGSSLDFSLVAVKLKELTDSLHLLTARFRASLETPQEGLYVSKMAALFDEVDERTVFARRLRQHNPVENFIEELAVPMTHKLINELEDGFTLPPVLKAFSVLNLKYLPNLVVELGDYGKADIETLASHYGVTKEDTYKGQRKQAPPFFNKATALAEIEGFKHIMFVARNNNPDRDTLQIFLEDENLKLAYPCMYKLTLLSRLVPASTASVERAFSLMNSLCTVNRNRLSQGTLESSQLTREQNEAVIDIFRGMKNREIVL